MQPLGHRPRQRVLQISEAGEEVTAHALREVKGKDKGSQVLEDVDEGEPFAAALLQVRDARVERRVEKDVQDRLDAIGFGLARACVDGILRDDAVGGHGRGLEEVERAAHVALGELDEGIRGGDHVAPAQNNARSDIAG